MATVWLVTACATNPDQGSEASKPVPEGYPAAAERLTTLLGHSMNTGMTFWEISAKGCRLQIIRTRRYHAPAPTTPFVQGRRGQIHHIERTTWTFPLGSIVRIQPEEHLIRVWTTKNAVHIVVDDTYPSQTDAEAIRRDDQRMDTIYTIQFDSSRRDNMIDVQDALLEVAQLCGARPYVERSR